jgi:hypothetical protein
VPALCQTAVDPRTITGLDHPVVHRPVPFRELPLEQFRVELNRAFGILGVNFKMDDAGHVVSPGNKFEAEIQRG